MEPPSLRCLLCDAFIFFWEGGEQRCQITSFGTNMLSQFQLSCVQTVFDPQHSPHFQYFVGLLLFKCYIQLVPAILSESCL